MKERKTGPVFKHYLQKQPLLLPPSIDELIPADHPARVIDELIGRMDLSELYETYYKGGGVSSYDPTMMLKVMILAYSRKIYSSRRIAQTVLECGVHVVRGGQQPRLPELRGLPIRETQEGYRSDIRRDGMCDPHGVPELDKRKQTLSPILTRIQLPHPPSLHCIYHSN
jgi:hypothetical protein